MAGGVPQFAKLANYEQEVALVVGQTTVLKIELARCREVTMAAKRGALAY